MNSRECYVGNIDVHRASYQKHLRSKKHLEKDKQNELIIPEWLVKEPFENKMLKNFNLKSVKLIAMENVKQDNKH